ncbi:DUF1501 domain-containing protein [Rubritalea spongiae]|uniref:DUF1501 domain-containing protein n=1 Tax=Rubritalea spongiae TaxID=430797 RepID=A0ABW5E0I7_9BACT
MKNSDQFSTPINRRHFLSTCGKMSALPVLSSLLSMRMLNAAVANNTAIGDDYKALVCVFLYGGNDSFNMMVPWTHAYHLNYLEARQHLALPKELLAPIRSNSSENMAHFGLHNALTDVAAAYRAGDIALMSNVGTLRQPTTLTDVANGNALPKGLYSHREQQLSWQTSVPENESAKGWVGRMSELINDTDSSSTDVSLNFSLNSASRLQTGQLTNPFQINDKGANILDVYGNRLDMKAAYDATLDYQYESVIKQHYAHKSKEIIDKNEFYNESIAKVGDPFAADAFPNTSLGKQLKRVALTIYAKNELGAKRQSFFVSQGGFDHHSELLLNQDALLPQLNDALIAFNNAMKSIGLHDAVTTYTASDFGRTISGNSSGTDHAWGGNQIVMGGAVNGNKVYGEYPSDLRPGFMDVDTGRGRFIPTTSVDELHAELACWYGVGLNDLPTVLPNINNFNYSPMGLMKL